MWDNALIQNILGSQKFWRRFAGPFPSQHHLRLLESWWLFHSFPISISPVHILFSWAALGTSTFLWYCKKMFGSPQLPPYFGSIRIYPSLSTFSAGRGPFSKHGAFSLVDSRGWREKNAKHEALCVYKSGTDAGAVTSAVFVWRASLQLHPHEGKEMNVLGKNHPRKRQILKRDLGMWKADLRPESFFPL